MDIIKDVQAKLLEQRRIVDRQAAAASVGQIDPEWAAANPDKATASITRAEWDQYVKDFVPAENQLLAKANDAGWVQTAANDAGNAVTDASARGAASLADTFMRRGVTPTDAQRKSITRRNDTATSIGVADAENTTRRSLSDVRTNLIADTLSIGRGIATSASGSLDSAANLAAARDAAGRTNSSATKANLSSGLVTAGAATGNPYLAGAGLALGLL